ncbi:MAG TPA: PAS domain S-box protein [Chryseosolibacter sp.]
MHHLKPSSIEEKGSNRPTTKFPFSDETYQRMIAEIEDYAILMIDPSGKVLNWNRGAEKIKGYKAEEIIGKNFRIFYPEKDRQELLPDKLLAEASKNNRAQHEGWRVRKDGSKFWGSVVITALHDDDGNVIGFSKVTRDLTERKQAEEAIIRNARELEIKNKELAAMNQELASFAYVSSHDLQEPLRKIQTFATRIVETEEATLSAKARDYFSRMQSAALRMQKLIEDLLAYSRTNTTEKKFERTDLNDVISEIRTELKETIESKKAKITVQKLPTLDTIRFQISQLFTNIFTNALKFSKPDVAPEITITHEVVEGSSFGQIANAEKLYHKISVSDNGIGFEPEHKHKIFEVFQRLHGRSEYSGTGIGLAICKKIVDNHGGVINAESELDHGATFNIYLPKVSTKDLTAN